MPSVFMSDRTIPAQINFFGPNLQKVDVDAMLDPESQDLMKQTNLTLLESFFDISVDALSSEVLERYTKISKDTYILFVPHSKKIKNKLLNPLRIAKKSYCLGDYLATIASCGMVAEMLALFLWNFSITKLNDQEINLEMEENFFGSKFENLGQERRLKILKEFGHINEDLFQQLNEIRGIRKNYLHFWSKEIPNEENDAFEVIKKIFKSFEEVMGLRLLSGKLSISRTLKRFYDQIEDSTDGT